MQLTEAEAAFRIHKSDLKIRPVWHQKTERVQAHILVCFLAYVVWKILGQMCKAAGLGDEPRRVFEELAKISAFDVVLPIRPGHQIRRRCVSQPSEHQAIPAAKTWPESAEKSTPDKQDFEKNVVKTFSVFKPKSTIYTPHCGSWVSLSWSLNLYGRQFGNRLGLVR